MSADPTASPRADAVTDLEARLRGFFQREHAAGVDSAYLEPYLRRLRPLQLAALASR